MILDEIAQYLHYQGIVTFDPDGVTGDCFISTLPSSPDECVAVYPSGGSQADGKLGYDTPSVQLIVRGTMDPRPALNRAQQIYDTLHGFSHGTFLQNGIWVLNCVGTQSGPAHIGRDQNGRNEYSLNFDLEIRNQSGNRE